jgi:hypothetical protein
MDAVAEPIEQELQEMVMGIDESSADGTGDNREWRRCMASCLTVGSP